MHGMRTEASTREEAFPDFQFVFRNQEGKNPHQPARAGESGAGNIVEAILALLLHDHGFDSHPPVDQV